MTRIPLVDVAAGVRPIREELLQAIARVVDSGHFAGGPAVAEFERAFGAYVGVPEAIAVSTGTDALCLSLRALGIGPGDEVITAPNSFFATAEAISLAGATPVFADVREDTLTIDPAEVARKRTPRTRAVVPVHLFGQCADVEALARLGLPILEDACQAHGATRHGRRAGALGDLGAFSFYPTKNLGALGEGGCVTTGSRALAARLRALRDHGQRQKNRHDDIGTNGRLDAVQCACLSVRLRHLDAGIAARRRLAEIYRTALEGARGVRLVPEDEGNVAVYHLLVARVEDRARVQARLAEEGIDTAVHYPTPIHLQPAYAALGLGPGSFPIAERAAAEILSLPLYPELAPEDAERVARALRKAVA